MYKTRVAKEIIIIISITKRDGGKRKSTKKKEKIINHSLIQSFVFIVVIIHSYAKLLLIHTPTQPINQSSACMHATIQLLPCRCRLLSGGHSGSSSLPSSLLPPLPLPLPLLPPAAAAPSGLSSGG